MAPGKRSIGRRQVLKQGAAAATALIPASALGREGTTSANDRIQIGVIGLGSRGYNLIDACLRHADAQIVTICDVDNYHHRDRPWGQGPAFGREPAKERIEKKTPGFKGLSVTSDYREVCQRKDIDAVVIATPDHWHAQCTLEALRHGKDVYCEKPLTHTFREGQLVYEEASKQKAVFQTGSQQRSDAKFRRAVELVRNGHLGSIQSVEVGLPPGYEVPQGDAMITQPPTSLDYDFWCGPAAKLPYMRARHHRWWRGHRAYGGGVLMDWIGHHNDIAHWALDADKTGPEKVEAVGWTFPQTDVYNTPHQYEIRCRFPGGIIASIGPRHRQGVKFIGENGWVFVTRGKLEASQPKWLAEQFQPGDQRVYRSDDHMGNFLSCIRSRKPCIAPAETAHRSITPGHLAYVSQTLGKPLTWDPVKEVVVGDAKANELLMQNDYRSPWG